MKHRIIRSPEFPMENPSGRGFVVAVVSCTARGHNVHSAVRGICVFTAVRTEKYYDC